MDREQQIRKFQELLEKAKTARTVAETQLEQLNKDKDEIDKEMQMLGVTPETIQQEIENIDKEIEGHIAECEKIINEFKDVI